MDVSKIELDARAFRLGYDTVRCSGCFAAVAIAEYRGDCADAFTAGARLAEKEERRCGATSGRS